MKKAWIAPGIDSVKLTATEFGGGNEQDPDFTYFDNNCKEITEYNPSES